MVDADGDATVGVPDLPQPAPDDAFAAAARDVLRGIVASAEEPAAGGRQKLFGRADLAVVPTPASAGSHLPRAVGLGLALERLRRGARPADGEPEAAAWPADSVVVCSFGDASVNHATVTAALNTAGWYDHTPASRCCSSARNSGGSAEGGWRRRCGPGPASATSRPTARTWPRATGWRRRRRLGAPAPPARRAAPGRGPADGPG